MDRHRRVVCQDNQDLANYMLDKWRELALKPKGVSDNLEKTLTKAYSSLCDFGYPIRTLKDLSLVKGVGKWILRLLQGFFQTDVGAAKTEGSDSGEDIINRGKKTKATRRYVPQKNSVAYALLITLYRATSSGTDFMRKQELIDATEASGLSRVPIVAEKGKGKPEFGSSPREWYTGWSCMKTLISKGLVVKSSNPAKYMLTQEGKEVACECLKRSGLPATVETSATVERVSHLDGSVGSDVAVNCTGSGYELPLHSIGSDIQMKEIDVPPEAIQRFTCMGYSKEQVLCAYAEVFKTAPRKDITLLWPAVLCHLRQEQVYGLCEGPQGQTHSKNDNATSDAAHGVRTSYFSGSRLATSALIACTSSKLHVGSSAANPKVLALPPMRSGERFEDIYKVILILDDREQFATRGSRAGKIIENIRSQFKIQVEVRHLPVGDGIWIARHKQLDDEYVLDFIVERKTVDDLRMSIRDSRYKDQKLRLLRCGLKKLIYLVEGDPNSSEASESIKTACFTTEILEGFDVHRTSGLNDTLRKYGHLTQAITQYYKLQFPEDDYKNTEACLSFDEFMKRCGELDKMTVGDVYAIQLMQVPNVTEEVALAVLDLYPTLVSLARAYSLLEGDVSAQEDMLQKQSNNAIKAAASKNIFQFVWGN